MLKCRNLKKLEDLESLIVAYQFETLDNSEAECIRTAKGVSSDEDPARVMSMKALAKYRSLLKEEKKLYESRGDSPCETSGQLNEPVQTSLFDLL